MNPGFERQGALIAVAPRGLSAFETGYHLSTRELLGGVQVSTMPLGSLPPTVLAELLRMRRLCEPAAVGEPARPGA